MMQYSRLVGWSAYWMLHSPMIPRWRTTFSAVSRSMWYSSLDRVWLGAMTIESPVWTPRGSKFSMLQTVMQLSLASLTTSYSTSFQPSMDLSTRICGEVERAFPPISRSISSLSHIPDPKPPSAKADLIIKGYPIFSAATTASSTVSAVYDFAIFSSICSSFSEKSALSSVYITASMGVPRTSTPYFSKVPAFHISTAQFRAVWPPMETTMPSGFSRLIISSTKSGVTGRKNTWSAFPALSSTLVCTLAIFGFMSTTSFPSSLSALIA
mmetsp:Transcript_2615/g.4742  ORF Transcript_2615/g.4742 Transcript_2615/m.4742 type:complete len:268 (-) Transcript_2615:850-1653(-)